MTKTISIIGGGAWGRALATIYSSKFYTQIYSQQSLEKIPSVTTVADLGLLKQSDYVFIAVAAQNVRGCLRALIEHNISDKIVLCSKGIEINSGKLLSQVCAEELPQSKIFVLSGPNFAHEIQLGMCAVSSLACKDYESATQTSLELSVPQLQLIPLDDIVGVQYFGALKNVVAILCGLVSGLEMGENVKAAIVTKAANEISSLSIGHGGKLATVLSPAGLGDLFLTCSSSTSRNFKFGFNLAKGADHSSNMHVEGAQTAKALKDVEKFPLLSLAKQIIETPLFSTSEILKTFENLLSS